MNKFCKRLRYSVGGTYRLCGPGKSLSVDKGSSRFFFVFTSSRLFDGWLSANPSVRCPFYSDNDLVPNAPISYSKRRWSSLQCLLLYLTKVSQVKIHKRDLT